MSDTSTVTHDAGAGRFELRTDAGTAHLDYLRRGSRIEMTHTEVPEAAEGRGYGATLAEAALEYARQEGLAVVPSCPFVAAYIQRHPEYGDLVAD